MGLTGAGRGIAPLYLYFGNLLYRSVLGTNKSREIVLTVAMRLLRKWTCENWFLSSLLGVEKKNNFRLSRNADFPVCLLTPTMDKINTVGWLNPCFWYKNSVPFTSFSGLVFCFMLFKKNRISQQNIISKWKSEMFCLETVGIKHLDWKKATLHYLSPNYLSNLACICKWIQLPWKLRGFFPCW